MLEIGRTALGFGCCLVLALSGCRQEVQLPKLQLEPKQLTFSESGAEDPSIIQAADGNVWIMWIDKAGSDRAHLWYAKSSDGQSWSEPFQITEGQIGNHYYPSLAQTSDGTLCVAWFSDRSGNADIWFSYTKDGTRWSSPCQVTVDRGWDWAPSLMEAPDKSLWLAWASDRAGSKDIWMSTTGDRENWSPPRKLDVNSKDNDDFPCLGPKGSDGVVLTWSRHDFKRGQAWNTAFSDQSSEVYFAISKDGKEWTPPEPLTQNNLVDLLSSQCPANEEGSTLIAWTSSATGIRGDVLVTRHSEAEPSPTFQLTSNKGADYSPKLIWFTGTLCSGAQEPGSDSAHQVDEQAQQINQLERQIRKLESEIGSLKIENQQLDKRNAKSWTIQAK